MINIALIVLSLCLVISGTMPLLGGKRVRGVWVRLSGLLMLALSILTLFVPTKVFLVLSGLIFGTFVLAYFFVKGDEPNTQEDSNNFFQSSKDELKTYADAAKGIVAFLLVLGVLFGGFMLVAKIIKGS